MKTYKQITLEMIQKDIRYLELLSHDFPNLAAASTEIINLEAILNLPKGTEHFLADLHGEYEAFQHVLRNASGAIKRKVNEISATTSAKWRKGTLHADILSGTEVTTGKGSGKRPRRLVCHHPEPAGKSLPECIIQIYTFKGTQGAA